MENSEQPRRGNGVVRFDSAVRVKPGLHIQNYTPEEWCACWYQRAEYKTIQQAAAPVDNNNKEWTKKKNYGPAALFTVVLLGMAFLAGNSYTSYGLMFVSLHFLSPFLFSRCIQNISRMLQRSEYSGTASPRRKRGWPRRVWRPVAVHRKVPKPAPARFVMDMHRKGKKPAPARAILDIIVLVKGTKRRVRRRMIRNRRSLAKRRSGLSKRLIRSIRIVRVILR